MVPVDRERPSFGNSYNTRRINLVFPFMGILREPKKKKWIINVFESNLRFSIRNAVYY